MEDRTNSKPKNAEKLKNATVSIVTAPKSAFDLATIYQALISAYLHQDHGANSPDKAERDGKTQQLANS